MKKYICLAIGLVALLSAPAAYAQFDNNATSPSANTGEPTTGNVNTIGGGNSAQPNGNTTGNGSNGGNLGNSSSNTTNSSSNVGSNTGANGSGTSQSGGVSGTGAGGGSGNYR